MIVEHIYLTIDRRFLVVSHTGVNNVKFIALTLDNGCAYAKRTFKTLRAAIRYTEK